MSFAKHLFAIQQSFIKSITYRSEIFLWFMLDNFPLVILFLVWASVYQGHQSIKGYTLAQILFYFLLGSVINTITASHFESWRVEQIREGKIDYYLTRPMSYLSEIAWSHIGGKLFSASISLSLFFLMFLALQTIFPFQVPDINWYQASWFSFFMITTFAIEFFFALIIVILGFWFEHSEGLEHFKWINVTLFSGWIIPLPMMPNWLRQIVEALPFKYMYAVPIGIIQNQIRVQWYDSLYASAFAIGLLIFTLLLWRKARYHYASAGG